MREKTKQPKSHSCGILLYRVNPVTGKLYVFLGQADGPRYWNPSRKRPTKIWGLPKGRMEKGEDELTTAKREFEEEVGTPAPDVKYKKMMEYDTPHNKLITVFKAKVDCQGIAFGTPEVVRREYPVHSGNIVEYTELKDAQWFEIEDALKIVMWGQKGILEKFNKDFKKKYKRKLKQAA